MTLVTPRDTRDTRDDTDLGSPAVTRSVTGDERGLSSRRRAGTPAPGSSEEMLQHEHELIMQNRYIEITENIDACSIIYIFVNVKNAN